MKWHRHWQTLMGSKKSQKIRSRTLSGLSRENNIYIRTPGLDRLVLVVPTITIRTTQLVLEGTLKHNVNDPFWEVRVRRLSSPLCRPLSIVINLGLRLVLTGIKVPTFYYTGKYNVDQT